MLSIFKDFLLNLFFILLPVFLVPFWTEQEKGPKRLRLYLPTVCYAIVIVLCITLPVGTGNSYIFDLRQIPLWLGSLYGGTGAAACLAIVTITYRTLFGGIGIFITAIVSIVIAVASSLLTKKFERLPTKQRILLTTTLSFGSGLLTVALTGGMAPSALPPLSVSLMFLLVQPASMFIVCAFREMARHNIALRKRIIRAEKMEAVTHLAASISHEIRNPLTAARGFIQLIEEQPLAADKRRQYARIAMEELDRAEAIITDYLTFAKPAPETPEKLNVKLEIERVIDIIRPLANMSCVDIKTTLSPFSVMGEREKFRQCLLNVMKNAIEAMPNGGTLQVYVSIDDGRVLIRIADTGVGMTKEQLERLGEPYFTTKGVKGTGLGMMVVYRIIESMNGTIRIESEIHRGTTVSIYLPLASSLSSSRISDKEKQLFAVL
ncbi:two-component sensor histidine kinase [Geobacillus sp. 47C-IIb]|jgi:two-component system sporulation sensor kinase B|uniref:ATP-binding protein n=1 Tax=Geobacillus TaxID=129337 RepID=UPI0009BEC6FF|nr:MULTISPECIES: ATP-binding protein [Geobacillus]ATO35883.1 two-component sensor histidine kinase [Geobacillus thermodenitrificans]MEC5186782.1 two-component system sporulation sensor kinase B [Geobacillus thermodenitrificans]OQP10959.1 two-component sensor histidine kinase [Geobacillus sp. 47C-IIb]QNU31438.1 two-component sensor histidine kinase [Geobacillus sp. 47C-IIb]